MNNKKVIAVTVAVLLVVGIAGYRMRQNEDHDPQDHIHSPTDDCGQGYGESTKIPVTKEQVDRLGIKITRAALDTVRREIRAPGEIKVNADRVAHIVPRVPGVVIEVKNKLGDAVKAGQVMAVVSSRDLADAKTAYLAAIERNDLNKTVFEREEKLWKDNISSEQDYLDAKKEFAEARIQLHSVRQKLHALGFSKEALEKIPLEKEEQLTNFDVTAPFDSVVIDKHITLGEVVGDNAEVFTVADLSSVWMDLALSQDAISMVRKGYSVTIRLPDGSDAETTVEFISPLVAQDTRTALARATIANPDGRFRPGTFVDTSILIPSKEETVVVPKASVQLVNDHPCVFVWGKADFELRLVETGATDGRQTEILQGLQPGEAVASVNAFHLKAEYIKSAGGEADAHAGHSH